MSARWLSALTPLIAACSASGMVRRPAEPTMQVRALRAPGIALDAVAHEGVLYALLQQGGKVALAAVGRSDEGRVLAELALDGVHRATVCGDSLLISGGLHSGEMGALAVGFDGRQRAVHALGGPREVYGAIVPLCIDGRGVLLWRRFAAPQQLLATSLGGAAPALLLEDPGLIAFAAAPHDGAPVVLLRRQDGLWAWRAGGAAQPVSAGPLDLLALSAQGDELIAAWSDFEARTLWLRRLDGEGRARSQQIAVGSAPAGERIQSLRLVCDGSAVALLWQTARDDGEPIAHEGPAERLWVAVLSDDAPLAQRELDGGGPGTAALLADALVVVHGEETLRITTLPRRP
jgi:hypothetical protein